MYVFMQITDNVLMAAGTSKVWFFFKKDPDGGKPTCFCGTRISYAGSSPTNMRHHLKKIHNIEVPINESLSAKRKQPSYVILTANREQCHRKDVWGFSDKMLAVLMCKQYLSFRIVETEEFQQYTR